MGGHKTFRVALPRGCGIAPLPITWSDRPFLEDPPAPEAVLMFVGHYGVSFAVKRAEPRIPLWVLFLAVQLVDVFWAVFVLLGIEKVRVVPGITASNPLDLYYMPYTHSLVGSLAFSAAAYLAWRFIARGDARSAGFIALAVFSHWVLDLLVHRPDMALWDDTMKVGLGLWNYPMIELPFEGAILFGGIWLYLRTAPVRRAPVWILGIVMFAVQLSSVLGPPPRSGKAMAWMALGAYAALAAIIARLERPAPPARERTA
jgi:hypothetical protein